MEHAPPMRRCCPACNLEDTTESVVDTISTATNHEQLKKINDNNGNNKINLLLVP